MDLPIVVYVDDSEQDARDVQRALHKHLNVHFIKPDERIEDLLDQIFDLKPDAIIVDFRLSDLVLNVGYDGYKVIQTILDVKDRFPVFILTSNEGDAFAEVDDVNFVYEKSQLHGNNTFSERVIRQVDKYKKKIQDNESRIMELIGKSKSEPLSKIEEDELIELDGFIERSLDKKSAVPDDLKITTNERRVSDILTRVNSLIQKVNEELHKA